MEIVKLRLVVFASFMTALMAVGAYIHVPIGPVPIVLTNLFVLLSGLLLGSWWALASTSLYVLLGAIGLPVFYGAKGGMAHLLGPTGGYLAGFIISSFFTGLISEKFRYDIKGDILAVIFGSIIIYCLGLPWLKLITKMSWTKIFILGMIPFLPGDAIKAILAIILARSVRPILLKQAKSFQIL